MLPSPTVVYMLEQPRTPPGSTFQAWTFSRVVLPAQPHKAELEPWLRT